MNAFESVSQLFQSSEQAVAIANRFSEAYANGVGHPEWHVRFGEDKPTDVAMNLAGLYAANSAATAIAGMRVGGTPTEEGYVAVLKDMAAGHLSGTEQFVARNFANVAWAAGQYFRSPDRITREVMRHFLTLPAEETVKDLVQVALGAQILLEQIEKQN